MYKTVLLVLSLVITYIETRKVKKSFRKTQISKAHFNAPVQQPSFLLEMFLCFGYHSEFAKYFQVRSAPRLVSDESILPHTPDLWKRGLILSIVSCS